MADGTVKFDTKIDDKGFKEGLDDLEKKTKKASNSMSNSFKESDKNLLNLRNTAKLVGTYLTGRLVKDMVTTGAEYNAQIEQYETSFKVMTGSAEKAVEITERLRKISAETPFELPELADTTQLLMQYGISADDAIDSMKMLGDISQGNADRIHRVAIAYGQMSSAQKVTLLDINQMIEAGFNPLQEISETTGESMESLYDRISKGTLSIDEITESMKRSTSEGGKYFNSMNEQSQTLSGRMSTLRETFNGFLGKSLKPFTNFLRDSAIPALTSLLENFDKYKPVLVVIGIVIGTLTALYFAYNIQQALATAQLTLWGAVCGIATVVTGALATAFTFLTSPIGLVILAIGALLVVGYLLYEYWDVIKAKMAEFDTWLTGVFTTDWSQSFGLVGDIMNGFFATVSNIWESIKQIFNGMIQFVKGVFTGNWSQAWQGVVNIFGGIWSGLGALVKAPLNAVISLVNGAIHALNGISVDIPKWVPKFGGKHFGLSIPNVPYLRKGAVLKKGQTGFLEGDGAEAVVPLERNKYWIGAVAKEMARQQETVRNTTNNQTVVFNQPMKSADEVARTLRIEKMYRLAGVR